LLLGRLVELPLVVRQLCFEVRQGLLGRLTLRVSRLQVALSCRKVVVRPGQLLRAIGQLRLQLLQLLLRLVARRSGRGDGRLRILGLLLQHLQLLLGGVALL
jgi:hypothetical protein